MKSKFSGFITIILILLIIIILGVFGVLIYQQFTSEATKGKVEEFVSTYTSMFDDTETEDEQTTQRREDTGSLGESPSGSTSPKNNVNVYFYDQLNSYSKLIYDTLRNNKEKMKSGTAQIEFGDSFSDLLSQSNGESLLQQYYQSAIECYLYDNPDVFYLSASKLYLNTETITKRNKKTYNAYINCGNLPNYFSDDFNSEEQVREAIQKVELVKNNLVANRTGDTYLDIKLVHDYLVNNVEYDTSLSAPNTYDIYGALVNGKSVCEGYAESFKYILNEMGIPCVIVIGTATNTNGQTENHAWNYVELNNAWYAVDATWDDPVIIGYGVLTDESKYKYFLRGSRRMSQEHVASGVFTEGGQEYTYPLLSINDYS